VPVCQMKLFIRDKSDLCASSTLKVKLFVLLCGFRANSTVVHCMIEKHDTGYGFAEPYFIHETLRDLVMYYRETTLVEHNEILDVTLKFPVLAAAGSAAVLGPSTPAHTVRRTVVSAFIIFASFSVVCWIVNILPIFVTYSIF